MSRDTWKLFNSIMGLVWDYYEVRRRPFWVRPLYVYVNRKAYTVPVS